MSFLERLTGNSLLTPHGYCLAWDPLLLGSIIGSDLVISLSYFSIPVVLLTFSLRRKDLGFKWPLISSSIFIMLCGITHSIEAATMAVPIYWTESVFKVMTATASIISAAGLWAVLPKLLSIPTREQLRVAQDTAIQGARVRIISKMTAGVAHDLNNRLMVIMANLEGLQTRVQQDPSCERSINRALTSVEGASALIHQLQVFSRRATLEPRTLTIDLQSVADLLHSTVRQKVRLLITQQEDIWPVKVDLAQFQDAIFQLCINASEAMPNGGKLFLHAENVVATAPGATAPSDYVCVSVTDSGIGMDVGTIEQATEPFFTTKGSRASGLGLSQAQGFAHQSDGWLRIESAVGKGTVVKIYLPRARLGDSKIAGTGYSP